MTLQDAKRGRPFIFSVCEMALKIKEAVHQSTALTFYVTCARNYDRKSIVAKNNLLLSLLL